VVYKRPSTPQVEGDEIMPILHTNLSSAMLILL
jgi:hypothetical protein